VAWYDETPANFEIFYKKSTDRGKNWTGKRLTWNSGSSVIYALTVDSSDFLHLVWNDGTPGQPEIYYKRSTDEGKTWPAQRLTWSSTGSCNPAITVDYNKQIFVVWHGDTHGNFEIYYKKGIQ
jgi:hypothetical protein